MTMSLEQVEKAARALPADKREILIDRLFKSLQEDTPKDVEKAWAEEAKRRLDDILSGKTKTVPGDQVMRELHQELQAFRK